MRKLVKKYLILLMSSMVMLLSSCSNNKDFVPSIFYQESDGTTEVRLELPDGESKIIYSIKEPLFASGIKCEYTYPEPMSGLSFLDCDTLYKLVNTSYAKTSGGEFQLFYLYQKNEEIIIFRENIWASGVGDSEVVLKGNLFDFSSDNESAPVKTSETSIQKTKMTFINNDIPSNSIELTIEGTTAILVEYEGYEKIRTINAKFINNELFTDDADFNYKLHGDYLCYTMEGSEYCYQKTKESKNPKGNYSFQSLSELRGIVISSSLRNMKKRLGEPNESMGADDYLLKYHNWKPFSVYSANRTMYSLVFVYESLLEKPVVVIFNNHNGKVFDVMFKDEIKSFEDLAVNYGND